MNHVANIFEGEDFKHKRNKWSVRIHDFCNLDMGLLSFVLTLAR